MGYQVIRVEKLKSAARISQRVAHAMRDHQPANADLTRRPDNQYFMPDAVVGAIKQLPDNLPQNDRTKMVLAGWRAKLPPKFRKDAVQALEFLVTGSHEDMAKLTPKQQTTYLLASADWIIKRFGGDGNLLGVSIHRDETTPHASVFIIPKVGDRLSAKHYLDGPKALAELHTEFNKAVARSFGFERGRIKSPFEHTSIKEFYALGREAMRDRQLKRAQEKAARLAAKSHKNEGAER